MNFKRIEQKTLCTAFLFFFLGLWDVYEGYVRGRTGWRSITSEVKMISRRGGEVVVVLLWLASFSAFAFAFISDLRFWVFLIFLVTIPPTSSLLGLVSGWIILYFSRNIFFFHAFVIPLSVQGPYHH